MRKTAGFLLILITASFSGNATHNMGGFITYQWISGHTYEATVTTYTRDSSPADRCEMELLWGDGSRSFIKRTNGSGNTPCPSGELVGNDIRMNIYKGQHTYQASGRYTLSVKDPNRNAGISNIPTSVNVPFFIETELLVGSPAGANTSVEFGALPAFSAEVNKPFRYNLSAFDNDEDIISYELIRPKGGSGQNMGSTIPDFSSIGIVNGELVWDSPQSMGQYVFAVKVSECRYGVSMGYVVLDFQVTVEAEQTGGQMKDMASWPTDAQGRYAVMIEPDDTLQLNLVYEDSLADSLKLQAYGEVLTSGGAIFSPLSSSATASEKELKWTPVNSDLRCAPYVFTFRGTSALQNAEQTTDVSLTVYVRDSSTSDCGEFCGVLSTEKGRVQPGTLKVNFAPNPFTRQSTLQIRDQKPDSRYELSIYGLSGKRVRHVENIREDSFSLNRRNLPAGIYLYNIREGADNVATGKLVITD